jgi:crotonobetainyl-CoA:carnitine CoA-transferase CaiB-like acyl-CoA transferase
MIDPTTPGALAGIRVIDFSQVAAGPYLTSLLGDLGADVIKVEPAAGDSLRGIDDAFGPGGSSYFYGVNRSKRDLSLDLRSDAARDVVDRLIGTADVLVVGMRPSALVRAGLDYPRLSSINSMLIYVSITGFGESGPRAAEPGMDILAQALSGVMGLTGERNRPPVRVGPPVADISTSYLAGFAICAALRARDRDGRGQEIQVNLLSSALSLLPNYSAQYLRTGVPIEPEGGAHPQIVPYQVFATQSGYMIVACLSNRFWLPLCTAIERPDLAGRPEYQTNALRVANREALVGTLTELFKTRETDYWVARMRSCDVPCAEVHQLHEVWDDPQVQHNQSVVELRHPHRGPYRVLNNPIRMNSTPPRPHRHAPDQGEHSREILAELGYTPDQIADLLARGAALAPDEVDEVLASTSVNAPADTKELGPFTE